MTYIFDHFQQEKIVLEQTDRTHTHTHTGKWTRCGRARRQQDKTGHAQRIDTNE